MVNQRQWNIKKGPITVVGTGYQIPDTPADSRKHSITSTDNFTDSRRFLRRPPRKPRFIIHTLIITHRIKGLSSLSRMGWKNTHKRYYSTKDFNTSTTSS